MNCEWANLGVGGGYFKNRVNMPEGKAFLIFLKFTSEFNITKSNFS